MRNGKGSCTPARVTALLALVIALGTALGLARHRTAWSDAPPDLLLLTVDTMRADRLGSAGHPSADTPVLDGLAATGTRFAQATTPFPRTTPALATIMTGLWPHHHGSREVREPLRRGRTLAEELSAAGFATVGISSSRVAGRSVALDRGFASFVDRSEFERIRAEDIVDRSLEVVGTVARDTRMFLWVHLFDPHFPYSAPGYAQDREAPCGALLGQIKRKELTYAEVYDNRGGAAEAARDDCSRRYDEEISYVDAELGRLLRGLAARRGGRPALIVLTSDHGENIGEDGLFYEHGPSVHDAALRVPLLAAGPGVQAGHTDTDAIRLEDLAPTLLAALDVPVPDGLDGVDLSARLSGAEAPPPPLAFAESGTALSPLQFSLGMTTELGKRHCAHGGALTACRNRKGVVRVYDHERDRRLKDPLPSDPPGAAELREALERWAPQAFRTRSVRTPELKLVARPQLHGGVDYALYDLGEDPDEQRDVSHEHPRAATELRLALEAWTSPVEGEAPPPSEDVMEDLRALGYVD